MIDGIYIIIIIKSEVWTMIPHFIYKKMEIEKAVLFLWIILNGMCRDAIACPAPVNLPKASLGKRVINECFDLSEINMSWESLAC